MKEKKHKRSKKSKEPSSYKRKRRDSSSSDSSDSEEWVEKEVVKKSYTEQRDDWMSMTGVIKTYTKDDIKSKKKEDNRKHDVNSYNPALSSRELNPYWKGGGSGLPHTPESFRKSKPFIKPEDNDNFYAKSSKMSDKSIDLDSKNTHYSGHKELYDKKSYNWKCAERGSDISIAAKTEKTSLKSSETTSIITSVDTHIQKDNHKQKDNQYLNDDKMNKLAAKIVKAEIMGNVTLATELKEKLQAAREYRKQNPHLGKGDDNDDDGVMLISTNSVGNSRPLRKSDKGHSDTGSKGKVETHTSGARVKYFGNDDKYNLAEMFEQEKYGNNCNDEAELAKIAGKHKNPNDDLEDIFMDEISKNRNEEKDNAMEKSRAIKEHKKIERSLEGCEYCVDSKNMLKHLIVSCGTKTYLAMPARKSLVKNHCIITTVQHATCTTAVDEDIWEEILSYRKALTGFFNSQNQDVLFYETAINLNRYPHIVINCVPMPRDVGDTAAIYFKKALLECEAEWSMNKKVVDLKGKNIRRGVPKGLPYFWIDFGMEPGFAHVIEDQHLFSKHFAEEVIAGILDLDHGWKNPQKDYRDVQKKKVLEFLKGWKSFDPIKSGSGILAH